MLEHDEAPFIVTLGTDQALQARFDLLRERYFPPARNIVPAHISLFHQLPAAAEQVVLSAIHEACAAIAPFPVRLAGVMNLGRGCALRLDASPRLHNQLSFAWRTLLTRQDSQPWRPHVTIQNKVAAEEARLLYEHLRATFEGGSGRAESIRLWRYLGGPWEEVGCFALRGTATP